MCSIPVLTLLDFSEELTIETDASEDGTGGALQERGKPISYMSKALTGRNLFLSVYEKEIWLLS